MALGVPTCADPGDPSLGLAVPDDAAADLPSRHLRRLHVRARRALDALLHPPRNRAHRLGTRHHRRPPRLGPEVLMAAGAPLPSALPYVAWSTATCSCTATRPGTPRSSSRPSSSVATPWNGCSETWAESSPSGRGSWRRCSD